MKIEKIIKPGQPGSKKWTDRFGRDLICIRYRVDKNSGIRIKTAEIIIDRKPAVKKHLRIPKNKLMQMRVNYNETYIRNLIKSAGGRWNPIKKVWELPYGKIVDLGLEKKIITSE